ncbi:hypothetical protein QO009_000428 [Brevibacillus aydinogluensis]|jgi:hypothetical protein|uniref:hypothetical protein n=1 Tax=Brevibacillus TaxID=55080 RepID=UPI001B94F426|nr:MULTISPECIES: hypothetical protein [Brevibacillus]MBR8660710.1 hypothetical protein [Brevibacillus sp. NL20B1]MDT3414584.1 hypothetical protein [Brevibacillus aydinogluensis]
MKKWGWILVIVWLLFHSVAYAEQQQPKNDVANRILSGLEESQKGTFIIKESSSLENDEFLDWLEKKTEVIRAWLTELSLKLSVKFLLLAGPFLVLGSVLLFFMGFKKILAWIWCFIAFVALGLFLTIHGVPLLRKFIEFLQ